LMIFTRVNIKRGAISQLTSKTRKPLELQTQKRRA
jgi:hypothetical protein